MLKFRGMFSLLIVIAFFAAPLSASGEEAVGETTGYATEFTAVELGEKAPATLQLAVQACAGLKNRKLGGSVFVKMETHDEHWMKELNMTPKETVSAADFLNACMVEFPSCLRYSYADQHEVMPEILTIASVLEIVPLDVEMTAPCGDVAFDATTELKDKNTPLLATEYVYRNYVDKTTGLAMLNPGYDPNPEDFAAPSITREMESRLVDFVFSQKLFATFLNNGCVDGNPEKKLLHDIVNSGHWPTPLGVYGYNSSWGVAGYMYEAQTRCLDSRNMGAIPSSTYNLSFYSTRSPAIKDASELQRNEPENIEYDPTKTYVAFVVGDGDNIHFIMTSRKEWLRQRLADCEKADNSCAPLSWTISPHLPRIAPDVLQWYYASSHKTGNDYFILPPSGHFYAYPTSMNKEDQVKFARATEQDARVLGVSSVVHWDWFDTWMNAEKKFLPKYANKEGSIRGVFPVNVPYMFPTFTWWPADKFYKILRGKDGGRVVVFRPREWRGVDGKGHRSGDELFHLTPQAMADEMSAYPPGTVTWVYMTSDGGLSLENSYMELVKLLPSRVRLVSADTAAKLALAAGD